MSNMEKIDFSDCKTTEDLQTTHRELVELETKAMENYEESSEALSRVRSAKQQCIKAIEERYKLANAEADKPPVGMEKDQPPLSGRSER